jgi:hypothetical protein
MHKYHLPVALGFLLTFSFVVPGAQALPVTPDFTLAATNVIMSSSGPSGSGSSTFTLTSVNGYAGTVEIRCVPPTPPAGVNVPICNFVPVMPPYTLTANQVVTGTISFANVSCNQCVAPVARRGGYELGKGLALAGVLLLGFGFRRRAARWLTLTLLAVGTLAGLAGIGACGGTSNVVTPGTYTYTITATDDNTQVSQTASINVIVP